MIRRLIALLARQFARYKKQPAKPEENSAIELSRIVIPIDICECVHCPLGKRTTLLHATRGTAVCELLVLDCHNDLEAYVRREGA